MVAATVLTGCAGGPVIVMPWAEPGHGRPAGNVIYFDRDAYKVDESYRGLLEVHARRMRERPSLRLRLEATTDTQGPPDYNLALARKRAQTVMKELVARGVPAERIELAGLGERQAGRTGAAHHPNAADRRVELIYR